MLTARANFLRPAHSSPSSGTRGKLATNQSGAWNRLPSLEIRRAPSQYARTPSSFSLIHHPVRSATLSQGCASKIGGAVLAGVVLGGEDLPPAGRARAGAAVVPT